MLFYGKTDVGKKRSVNQDNFIIKKYSDDVLVAIVCDGMGGANGGNIASAVAADAFLKKMDAAQEKYPSFFGMSGDEICAALKEAAGDANRAVYLCGKADSSLSGMGTTLVACVVSGENLYVVNVGDSRLYKLSCDGIKQLSHDHSYVQYLVDVGKMTKDEARHSTNKNLITRAVGTEAEVEADIFTSKTAPGDFIVMCSDGLTNHVNDEEISNTVKPVCSADSLELAAESLIWLANSRGGLDNITAVILSI